MLEIEKHKNTALLAVLGVVVAILAGGVTHFIGRYFYVVIFMPVLLGAACLGFGTAFITNFRYRNSRAIIIIMAISGILAYLSMHFFDFIYYNYKSFFKGCKSMGLPCFY